jgi:hypothetical protein
VKAKIICTIHSNGYKVTMRINLQLVAVQNLINSAKFVVRQESVTVVQQRCLSCGDISSSRRCNCDAQRFLVTLPATSVQFCHMVLMKHGGLYKEN